MIDAKNESCLSHVLVEMFKSRAKAFGLRRGWDVSVENGKEIDIYDNLYPMYLVAIDELTGVSLGSLRILPTTGRNMTKEVFAHYFDEDIDIQSPLIWECTRFCLHNKQNQGKLSLGQISLVTSELLIGLCELALQSGIEQILAIIDEPMRMILKRARWQPAILASTTKNDELIHAGLWDVSKESIIDMRVSSGVSGNIFEKSVVNKVA